MTLPGMTNLNSPAAQSGAVCESDLDEKSRDLGAWEMLAEPLDLRLIEPVEPWWIWWLVYPGLIALVVSACFEWPLWIQP